MRFTSLDREEERASRYESFRTWVPRFAVLPTRVGPNRIWWRGYEERGWPHGPAWRRMGPHDGPTGWPVADR